MFGGDGMNSGTTARRSIVVFFALICSGLLASILRVGYLSVIKGSEYKSVAEAQQLSVKTLSATRGTIYDANMNVLAQSASVWLVYINPSKLCGEDHVLNEQKAKTVASGLAEILDMNEDDIYKKIADNPSYGYVEIKGKIELETKTALQKFIKENNLYGIVSIDPDNKRYYPNSSLASTVIGFTGKDGDGLYGVEYYYNDQLTGTNGRIVTAKDGTQTEMPNQYETTYLATDGVSLVLTINNEVQTILESALETGLDETQSENAYGIVMNVKTGAILAMANLPDYDPNDPYSIYSEKVKKNLAAIENEEERNKAFNTAQFSQWKNKAVADFYEPGSVFKVFLVSAALESGVVNSSYNYTCAGYNYEIPDRTIKDFNPYSPHHTENLCDLLVNSCNTFSVHVGLKVGVETFSKYFEAFGFTEKTGIDLIGETSPTAGVTYHPIDNFTRSDLASCSFGQTFEVSPLQIITAMSAIANGGKLMTPYVVQKELDRDGNVISETEPKVKRQVISEATAATVASYMEQVVIKGSGMNAYVAGYRVAGKTGTSEKLGAKEDAYIASFAGFAPVNNPEIAVIIAFDEPKGVKYTGGVIAAPVAGEVIEKTLKYLGVKTTYTDEELAELTQTAPNLVGMSLSEAKSKLDADEYEYEVVGDGDTVVNQSPEEGRQTPKNGIIIIYTDTQSEILTATVPDFTGLSVSAANSLAVENGLNIKISGSSFGSAEVVAYKQSDAVGSVVNKGAIITVYFRSDSANDDLTAN